MSIGSPKNISILILMLLVGFLGGLIGGRVTNNFGDESIISQSNFDEEGRLEQEVVRVVEDSSVIDVVEHAQSAVVSIVATKEVSVFDSTGFDFFDGFFDPGNVPDRDETVEQQVSGGSGFIIKEDGLILTNRHVVSDPDATYTVILNDGREFEATVIDKDVINDIAFIDIEAQDLPILSLGDSDKIQIGQTVIAIGNTLSEYSNTVTRGIVSGIDRRVVAGLGFGAGAETLESAIQTDAAINPGNSGGPLLNLAGQVIGINTAVDRSGEGIGFAIPINEAKTLVDDVIEQGRIIRPFLGVRYVLINERIATREDLARDHGALVLESSDGQGPAVVPDSPAAAAGLEENDIIFRVNERDITIEDGLAEVLSAYRPGDTVSLFVQRGDSELELQVTLADRDDFNQ